MLFMAILDINQEIYIFTIYQHSLLFLPVYSVHSKDNANKTAHTIKSMDLLWSSPCPFALKVLSKKSFLKVLKVYACKSLRYKIEMLLMETHWHNYVAFLQLSLSYKIKLSLSESWHFKVGIIFSCQFCWLIWLCLICYGVVIQLLCLTWLLARIVGLSRGISDTLEELSEYIFFRASDCWYDGHP